MIENAVKTQWAFERYPKLRQINFCGENFSMLRYGKIDFERAIQA